MRLIILRRTQVTIAAVGVALAVAVSVPGTAAAAPEANGIPDLGVNVTVFDPSMPVSGIQATLDAAHAAQVDNEMGTARYAFLFQPGTYGTAESPLQIKVGYYTEIAGLGTSPTDVVINGKVETYNRCLAPDNCVALVNFWRTVSNLSINVNSAGQDGCRASANFWAVSQAASMRRVAISGNTLSLMDYCTAGPQFASGGFIADSSLPNTLNGSQQQWLTRNSEIGGWTNGVWNQVFSGVVGAPDDAGFPVPPYTTLDTTPVSREKPYLFVNEQGDLNVRVPAARTNTSGTTWADGVTPGRTLPISDFFVADPSDSVQTINSQLARGKHLLLTPGVYDIARTIKVKRADTVVLGLGHATLTAVNGSTPLVVSEVPGVIIAGVTVDAGPDESPVLLRVGSQHGESRALGAEPDDAVRRVLPRRRAAPGQRRHRARGQQRPRPDRSHLGLAGRPRRRGPDGHRALEHQHRPQRRGRQRRPRDRQRAVRGTLSAVQHRLERRRRHHDPLPERTALRPADPGRLDERHGRRAGPATRSATGCGPTR